MFDLANVFTKVFVREFYRLNAGFFIVVTTLTFGFMSGAEHKALAEFFVASPLLSLIPIGVWSMYALKVILFNHQRLQLPQNRFLFETTLVSSPRQFSLGLQTVFVQFAPVVAYAGFLLMTALKNGRISTIVIIICSVIVLLILSAIALMRGMRTPIPENKTSALKLFIDRHTVRPLWWIYIVTVLRQEPFLFFGTKIFTGVLLFAISQLYIGETYDGRLLAMGATIGGAGNYMIVMQLQLFELKYLNLMRALPITLMRRWIYILLISLILVAPETVVLWKYAPVGLTNLVSAALLIPCLAMLLYSLLYVRFENQETYGRIIFGVTIAHIVLILFKVPVPVLIALDLTTSWLIFQKRYYKFELQMIKAPSET